jgi:hypothetical protein
MQQLMAMQQNPQAMQNPQIQMQMKMVSEKIEARKAQLIADMMEEFMKEEKKITSQFDNDPIAKLRSRELDLQAQENARKKQEGEERINLDKNENNDESRKSRRKTRTKRRFSKIKSRYFD